ncbi:hypothetical protein KP509_17G003100 [Ceratopteris richardii]|nr:hypothetical protein KP509_17G003100 [Ceratopteris richardii]
MTVTSALMDMYGKCIRLPELQKLFGDCPRHDAVSWASFISTYIEQGSDCCASDLLKAMGQLGIMPDQVLFLSLLRACVVMPSSEARIIHDCIIKANFETDQVVANCLVSMYAKIGCLQEAEITFRKVEVPDIISCSSMIFGYDHAGFSFLACELFEKMQEEGIHSDRVSFLGVLKAYGSLGAVRKGRLVHGMLIESGFESDVEIGNTLVDMYAKCGSLQEAEKVFDRLQKRDSISWQILFSGYIQHGNRVPLIRLLQSMQCEGLKPNDVVFMNALAGCSHAGLHEDGEFLFNLMRQEYNISPSVEHYNCMLDLHGRMGSLLKAKDMLQTMPSSVNFIGWSTLLNVCRSHGNSVLGSHCFMALSEVDPRDASSYMLMCSLLTSNS